MKKVKYYVILLSVLLCGVIFAACGAPVKDETRVQGEWVVTVEPTCEKEGEKILVSQADGTVLETGTVAPRGHLWGDWVTTTEPTCLTAGVETRTCQDCANIDVRPVPALGHDFGDWVVIQRPTCTSAGRETAVCKRDGTHTLTRTVDTLGHDFSEWVITSAPTCTSPGVETRYCRNDNTHRDIRAIPKLEHKYGDWYIEKAPTCTEAGVEARVCANDSAHKETRAIAATGHDWSDWVVTVPPTGTSDGIETRICRNDGTHVEENATGSPNLLFYPINDDTEYSVAWYSSGEDIQTLYVPSTHWGKPVTAFERCSSRSLKKIVFADGIETIKGHAFYNCTSLTEVVFPQTLKSIENQAFLGCTSLTEVVFPQALESIELAAFSGCTSLTEVVFPQTLKSIGNIAFAGTNLTNLTLPERLETIGAFAFQRCPLAHVYIPASVRQMGTEPRTLPFWGPSLTSFEVSPDNATFSSLDGVLFNKDRTVLLRFPEGKICETYSVPDTVTEISDYAFGYGTGLKNIVIPSSVTFANSRPFYENSGIESVSFEEGSKKLDFVMFGLLSCKNLTAVRIPASMEEIVVGKQYKVLSLSAIDVHPDNLNYSSIDGVLFDKAQTELLEFPCAKGGDYVVPAGVERIGAYAFTDCTDITSIVLPGSVKEIGESAFSGADNISEIHISQTVERVGNAAFSSWKDTQTIFIAFDEKPAGWSETWIDERCKATVVWGAGEIA